MPFFYLANVYRIPKVETFVIEEQQDDGTVSKVIREENTLRVTPFPPEIELPFGWSAAYSLDYTKALIRTESELPETLYEKKLETQEDFEEVYSRWNEFKNAFQDLPY